MKAVSILVVLFHLITLVLGQACQQRSYGADSFVCVCNSTYCDFPGSVAVGGTGQYATVTSSRDGARFEIGSGTTASNATGSTTVHINHNYEYQTIFGFGGAFTDAAGINIKTLSPAAEELLMRSYFAPEGIEYNLCRVPIAGSDFSTYAYSYDDVPGDVNLTSFALAQEDYLYKLPLMKRAIELTTRGMLFFGSPWAPPAWMKENGMHNGTGGLLKEMWQPYSNYLVKFVQAYEGEGIPIWGLTPQNEPLTGFQDWPWNTCAWTAEDMRDWIKGSFGPTMVAANLTRIKVMVLDHNRDALLWYPATIMEDPAANPFVHGTAVHWYADDGVGPGVVSELQILFPDKFILYTESCEGWDASSTERVILGSWARAEAYADNIIDDVNHFSTGWVDWNMALDMGGGPNWANNFVDSPVIINNATDEFYKQPMFYAMGHFSKYVVPGSKRVYTGVAGNYNNVKASSFHTPTGQAVVLVLNKDEAAVDISIETDVSTYINMAVQPKSLHTIIFDLAP